AAVFEAVEGGVEGGDVEADRAVGAAGDQLADFVAVPLALLEERQDQQLGAAAFELALEFVWHHIWARTISLQIADWQLKIHGSWIVDRQLDPNRQSSI